MKIPVYVKPRRAPMWLVQDAQTLSFSAVKILLICSAKSDDKGRLTVAKSELAECAGLSEDIIPLALSHLEDRAILATSDNGDQIQIQILKTDFEVDLMEGA